MCYAFHSCSCIRKWHALLFRLHIVWTESNKGVCSTLLYLLASTNMSQAAPANALSRTCCSNIDSSKPLAPCNKHSVSPECLGMSVAKRMPACKTIHFHAVAMSGWPTHSLDKPLTFSCSNPCAVMGLLPHKDASNSSPHAAMTRCCWADACNVASVACRPPCNGHQQCGHSALQCKTS